MRLNYLHQLVHLAKASFVGANTVKFPEGDLRIFVTEAAHEKTQ
jgi:hypothetical protein